MMNEYEKRVLKERARVDGFTKETVQELQKVLEDAIKELEGSIPDRDDKTLGLRWRKDYLKALKEKLKELKSDSEKILTEGMRKGAETGTEFTKEFLDRFFNTDGSFRSMFSQVQENVINSLIEGEIYKDGKTLSQRIWNYTNQMGEDIDSLIKRDLTLKKSAREIRNDLRSFVKIPKDKRFDFEDSHDYVFHRNKYVNRNAERLARTLINHSYQTATIQSSRLNPFCDGLKWLVANDHRVCPLCLSREGITYKADDVPLDHPNGRCALAPVISKSMEEIGKEIGEWVRGEENPRLDEWYRGLSDFRDSGYNKIDNNIISSIIEADNMKEANRIAENMGFMADYKGIDLKCANEWNKGLYNAKQQFPEVAEKIKFVGAAQKRNTLMKKELQDYYEQYITDKFKERLLKKGYDKSTIQKTLSSQASSILKQAKKWANIDLKGLKIDSNTMAVSLNYSFTTKDLADRVKLIKSKYQGITMSNKYFGNYDYVIKNGLRQMKSKFHPDGCYDVKSTFDHEFTHQIDRYLGLKDNNEIKALWNNATRESMKNELSEYAYGSYENWVFKRHKDAGEMIAEAWSEYNNSPNPRDMAKKIAEELNKLWKNKKSP